MNKYVYCDKEFDNFFFLSLHKFKTGTVKTMMQWTIFVFVACTFAVVLTAKSKSHPEFNQWINEYYVELRLLSNRSQMTSNKVRTKKKNTGLSQVCLCCSYTILTPSVIHYCTDPRQHGILLFHII